MISHRYNLRALLLIAALAVLSGCAKNVPVAHPNQINSFDGAAYDTLVVVQASLNQVKAAMPKYPQYKEQFNLAAASYNATIAAYKTYHAAASQDPTAQAALQTALTSLVGEVGKLLAATGVKL